MQPAIRSALDAAAWFEARADRERVRLAPLHQQRLLYLAQALFARATGGGRLMPAVFVAADIGPVDPNLYLIMEHRLEFLVPVAPSQSVERLLETIWQQFGRESRTELERVIEADPAVQAARAEGRNSEITLIAMAQTRVKPAAKRPAEPAPVVPKAAIEPPAAHPAPVVALHKGHPVRKWRPKRRVDGPTLKLG